MWCWVSSKSVPLTHPHPLKEFAEVVPPENTEDAAAANREEESLRGRLTPQTIALSPANIKVYLEKFI